MASPRTMWSGSIRLALLHVPISIGKAWSEEKEASLKTLCTCCNLPIDRTERCPTTGQPPQGKSKGVQKADGTWHAFDAQAWTTIEDATKSKTLDVIDVQPTVDLPMQYATGAYYVRADTKQAGSEQVFALLAEGLEATGYALIVKWGTSARQKLAAISCIGGVMFLHTLPMANELRTPGKAEVAHHDADVDDEQINLVMELLTASRKGEFDHSAYADEGLKLRQEAVDAALHGQKPAAPAPAPAKSSADVMAAIRASMEAMKADA